MQPTHERKNSGSLGLAIIRDWPVVLFLGIVTVGLGTVVLSWPGETLIVISVLIGIQLMVFGLYRLILAFSDQAQSPAFTGLVGVMLMIASVIALRHPFETVAVLATLLGVVCIVAGVIDAVDAAANERSTRRLFSGLIGLSSIAAGVVVVAWPAPTVAVISWIIGFYLVVFGLFVVVNGLALRNLARG